MVEVVSFHYLLTLSLYICKSKSNSCNWEGNIVFLDEGIECWKVFCRCQICKRKDPGCQNTFSYRCFAHSCDCWDYRIYKRKHYEDLNTNTVNSLYSGHCRDLELVSSIARVRNSGSLYQSNACNLFLPVLRIIGVSVIAGCPQGESWLYHPPCEQRPLHFST